MKGVPMVERSFSGPVCPAGYRKLEVKVLSAPGKECFSLWQGQTREGLPEMPREP
jgi:hypothetical protein